MKQRIVLAVGGRESNITADSITNILHTYVARFSTSFGVMSQIHSFIHSFHWHMQHVTIPCHSRELLPFLSVTSLLCHLFFHPLTLSCHLFLGLHLNLVVPKFIYHTLLGILFSSILCTCPNQCNLFNLIVSVVVGFLTLA